MIYFLQPIDGGPFKIGYTDNLDRRHGELEAIYGCSLALLATRDGGKEEETAIHRRFRHLRLGRTEQFRPAADLMEFIGLPLLVGANPDAVEAMEGNGWTVFSMKISREFKEWLEGLATHNNESVPQMLEMAAIDFAKKTGYKEPKPKRTGGRS